jgi:alpha-tubulin suppressor-like RCC1 family protein
MRDGANRWAGRLSVAWLGLILAMACGQAPAEAGAQAPLGVARQGLQVHARLSAGDNHTLAVHASGGVWAWGDNSNGQLGDGTTVDRHTPVRVPGLSGVVSVSAGYAHSLAVLSDGTVWAWGSGYDGQLGNGSMNENDSRSPVKVSGLTGVVAMSASRLHSLALRSDETVWAWGSGDGGRLGDGFTVRRVTPVQVVGLNGG